MPIFTDEPPAVHLMWAGSLVTITGMVCVAVVSIFGGHDSQAGITISGILSMIGVTKTIVGAYIAKQNGKKNGGGT